MLAFTRYIGRIALSLVDYLGELVILAGETARAIALAPIRWRLTMIQLMEVGFRSQLVVIVTGGFTGAVFAAQTFFQFHRLGMDSAVGAVVSVSMCRELGPVLTGLMVAGRVGAAIAAEIGTMKVTEQIDALRALGVHPIDYLVVPRALSLMIAMPLLVGECIAFGIVASYVMAVVLLGIPGAYFLSNMVTFTDQEDVVMGIFKGFCFSVLIVFISCHQGLNAKEGAFGVGRAPTEAVVIGSLAILISKFFLTMALNIVFPAGV